MRKNTRKRWLKCQERANAAMRRFQRDPSSTKLLDALCKADDAEFKAMVAHVNYMYQLKARLKAALEPTP